MPNGISYTAGPLTGAMRKNNFALAISGNYGPTVTTGVNNGVEPIGSGALYIIYKTNVSNVSNVFAPKNTNELISLARQEGATQTFTASAADCLRYFAATNFYMPTNFTYPPIVTSGLSSNFDAGFVGSYPTTGTIWYGLTSPGGLTLQNGPVFLSGSGYGSGSLSFDGINDQTSAIGSTSNGPFTVSVWVYTNLSVNATYSIIGGASTVNSIGLIYSNGTQSIQIGTTTGANAPFIVGTDGNNGWVNYTITRDGGNNITIYKNNVLFGTSNRAGQFILTTIAKSATSAYYKGLIGSIQFYINTSLTSDQRTENYNALKGIYGL